MHLRWVAILGIRYSSNNWVLLQAAKCSHWRRFSHIAMKVTSHSDTGSTQEYTEIHLWIGRQVVNKSRLEKVKKKMNERMTIGLDPALTVQKARVDQF